MRTISRLYAPSRPRFTQHRILWTFHGTEEDQPRRWQLTYDGYHRRFTTANATDLKSEAAVGSLLDADVKTVTMNLTGRTITEILRSQLRREDVAACTRLSLSLGAPT